MLTDAKSKPPSREAAVPADLRSQLYLLVSPAGGRHWRMNYAFGKNAVGKPKQPTLSLGSNPAMTLPEQESVATKQKHGFEIASSPA